MNRSVIVFVAMQALACSADHVIGAIADDDGGIDAGLTDAGQDAGVDSGVGDGGEGPPDAGDAGATIECGAANCSGSLICCRSALDGGLRCDLPNASLTGAGQRCPMPGLETSMECDGQTDCPSQVCCGGGGVSQCASATTCGAGSRVCRDLSECGAGENCCPGPFGPLRVCQSTSC